MRALGLPLKPKIAEGEIPTLGSVGVGLSREAGTPTEDRGAFFPNLQDNPQAPTPRPFSKHFFKPLLAQESPPAATGILTVRIELRPLVD